MFTLSPLPNLLCRLPISKVSGEAYGECCNFFSQGTSYSVSHSHCSTPFAAHMHSHSITATYLHAACTHAVLQQPLHNLHVVLQQHLHSPHAHMSTATLIPNCINPSPTLCNHIALQHSLPSPHILAIAHSCNHIRFLLIIRS